LHSQAGEEILDTYEQERRPHATRIIRAAVTVGWALTGGQDRAAIIHRIALAGLCRVAGFSTAVVDSASPRLTGSALIDRRLSSETRPGGCARSRPSPPAMTKSGSTPCSATAGPCSPTGPRPPPILPALTPQSCRQYRSHADVRQ
jgi:hypothetical protein